MPLANHRLYHRYEVCAWLINQNHPGHDRYLLSQRVLGDQHEPGSHDLNDHPRSMAWPEPIAQCTAVWRRCDNPKACQPWHLVLASVGWALLRWHQALLWLRSWAQSALWRPQVDLQSTWEGASSWDEIYDCQNQQPGRDSLWRASWWRRSGNGDD